MVFDPAQKTPPTGGKKSGKKRLVIIALVVGALLVAAAVGIWWALQPAAEGELGSPDAVATGEKVAADLAERDTAVIERQTVASPDLFHYEFDDADLAEGNDGLPFIANQLVVSTTDEAGLAEAEAVAEQIGARVVGANTFVNDYQLLLDEPLDHEQLAALSDDVTTMSGVEAAEDNLVTPISYGDVDTPQGGSIWDGSWGSSLGPPTVGNWGMQAIGAPVIWDYADAHPDALADATVGVVDLFHRDWWHKDLEPDPQSLLPSGAKDDDTSAHGLHVSGTIATRQDQQTGVRGVAPNGHLVISSAGEIRGDDAFLSWAGDKLGLVDRVSVDQALTFVVESGAKVVNMSFGAVGGDRAREAQEGDESSQNRITRWADDRASVLNDLLTSHDFLVVKAAGNASCTQEQVDAEENDCSVVGAADAGHGLKGSAGAPLSDHLITVGATTSVSLGGFEVAWYSDSNADVVAPGTDILSAWDDDGYHHNTGTSMAAPHVSGLAAALFGANPDLTATEVRQIIVGTSNAAPLAQWNQQADHKTSAPMVNGAAAFQVALTTTEMGVTDRSDLLTTVASGAVSLPGAETKLSTQLLGTWCAAGDDGASTSDCFNLRDHFIAGEQQTRIVEPETADRDPSLWPEDPTGRGSIASSVALCDAESCDEADPRVRLRYFPPGAVSDSASNHPAHDVSYPRIAEVTWDDEGRRVMGDPYRLAPGMDGTFADLPFEASGPPPLSPDDLDGYWRLVGGETTEQNFIIRDETVHYSSGETENIFQVTSENDGTMFIDVIARGYSDCAEEASVCAPLGLAIPAGTPADTAGAGELLDHDRIWRGQTGEMFVREPLPAAVDFPPELRGEWCAKDDAENCFSVDALLESTPSAFLSGEDASGVVDGAIDFSICQVANLGADGCTTSATMFLRYFPSGVEWDCAEFAKDGKLPLGFTACDRDFAQAHDGAEPRLIIMPNHQHGKQYVDSVPLYRTDDAR